MQFKVMPLCLGMGIGMIAMKLICMKQESCKNQCYCLNECSNEKEEEKSNENTLTKAKETVTQVINDLEKLEMSDIKAKTKEALGQIKQKIQNIHL